MSDATLKGPDGPNSTAELLSDMAREVLARSATLARNISFRSWPYRASLSGPMPDRFMCHPESPAPGSAQSAEQFMSGVYALPGGTVHAKPGTAPWELVPPNDSWAEALHGFEWLSHFKGQRNSPGNDRVHWFITTWMEQCGHWHNIGWRPHVIARRLISWFLHAKLISGDQDLIWRSTLMCSIASQVRHLARTAQWAKDGEAKLTAAIGLSFAGSCLPNGERWLEQGMNLLLRELDKQILPDGGHISRNPSVHVSIWADLSILKSLLIERKYPVPEELDYAVDNMTPMVRLFQHRDGRLALFNGACEESSRAMEALLAGSETHRRAITEAPYSGYQKLEKGRTSIIIDTGPPPKPGFSQKAHAGCLSFEMSTGHHRLIVNCGSTALHGPEWQSASRATAAHSTATLADKSSARFLSRPLTLNLVGPRVKDGPQQVLVERNENQDGIWLTASHDGYSKRFGLIHERRLFLNANGEDLRGEDLLISPDTVDDRTWIWGRDDMLQTAIPFSVRFHLHPDVRPSLRRGGDRVLLMLPNGDGWTFQTNGPVLSIEESIYLGSKETVRRTTQVVVSGIAERSTDRFSKTSIKWAIYRMADE